MQRHILDNPVWQAMSTGNKNLATLHSTVGVFPSEVSPIVGLEAFNTENFHALHDVVTSAKPVVVFSVEKNLVIPDCWKLLVCMSGYQMMFTPSQVPEIRSAAILLDSSHLTEMLALTALTNPGPFSSRTPVFGNYEGIFLDGKLVAMAGHRLHPGNYVEISAVCTHPAYTGRGLAAELLLRQADQILRSGNLPFLHVRDDNEKAVRVYERLGFRTRTAMYFYVLQKTLTSK